MDNKKCNRKDLVGQKFGLLLAIEFVGMRKQGKTGKVPFYKCLCECGNIKEVKGTHLSRGDTKTCGDVKHRILPNYAAKARGKWLSYKNHAENRGLSFNISYPFFDSLLRMSCFFCKEKPIKLGGVDRLDNDIGYEYENCVPCCGFCNAMKSDLTLNTFMDKIGAIYENF